MARTRHRSCVAGAGCGIPRVRAAASAALRQRCAVCLVRGGRTVAAVGQGDQGRGGAGAHRARQAAAERPAGAAASDAAAGHRQPAGAQLREQLERLRSFQRLYNEERPHQALGNATPAEHYAASPRRFDGVLRAPNYGADHEVRCVRHNGEIRWQRRHHLHQRGLDRRAGRSRRKRRRRLDRLLRSDHPRHHRS